MGHEVLQSLVDSGDLDAKYLAAIPTFTAVSLEWSAKNGHGCVPKESPF
jgi:hypothetical protein